jgi:hypothetical protein
MDRFLTSKETLLGLIDELLTRGAYQINIGDLSVAFERRPAAVAEEKEPVQPVKAHTPEELEALLYQETLKL